MAMGVQSTDIMLVFTTRKGVEASPVEVHVGCRCVSSSRASGTSVVSFD